MKEDEGQEHNLLQQIMGARQRALDGARPDAVAKAHKAGRLTARERLNHLLDSNSVVEYGVLAGATSQADDESAADGLVACAGKMN